MTMHIFTGSTIEHMEQDAESRMPELRAQAYSWKHGRSGILSFMCWSDMAREALETLFKCAGDPAFVADLCMEESSYYSGFRPEEDRNSHRCRVVGMALEIFECLPAAA